MSDYILLSWMSRLLLASICKQRKFTGNALESFSVPIMNNGKATYYTLVGLGGLEQKGGISGIERYRRALGQLVKEVRACGGASVAIELSLSDILCVSKEYLAEQR